MLSTLAGADIDQRLASLKGWTNEGNMIAKTYKLPTFPAAIAFTTQVGFLAEAAQHHPDIDIRYKRVTLRLSTHDAGGLTSRDFDLAQEIEKTFG